MTCEQFREWIIDDLVDELSAADRRTLEEHLEGCDRCVRAAHEHRQLWSDLPHAAALPAPTRGLAALQARVADELPGEVHVDDQVATDWRPWLQRAAAALVLVGIGVIGGIQMGGPVGTTQPPDAGDDASDEMPRFALLFYEVPGGAAAKSQASDDISTWARSLFRQGVVETGAEMADEAAWAGPPPGAIAGNRRVTFYIRIRATDLEQARQIAATAPVTAYGGVIEIRPLDP